MNEQQLREQCYLGGPLVDQLRFEYITCQCTDMGCTVRVMIDKDPNWPGVWLEYQLNHHLPFRKRFWDGIRYIFGLPLKNTFSGTMLSDKDVEKLRDWLDEYLD